MKKLLGMLPLAVALFACAPALPSPTPTPTATATSVPPATPSPSPTPLVAITPSPAAAKDAFTAFAQRIAAAMEKQDAAAIVSATVPTMVDCRGQTEETPWCSRENLGRVLSGVKVGPWGSEYSLFSQHDYQTLLGRFFAEARAQASDRYGSGKAALLAIGSPGGKERDLILSAITQRGREALLLRSQSQGDRWGIEGVVVVGTPFVGEVLPPGTRDYRSEPWGGGR